MQQQDVSSRNLIKDISDRILHQIQEEAVEEVTSRTKLANLTVFPFFSQIVHEQQTNFVKDLIHIIVISIPLKDGVRLKLLKTRKVNLWLPGPPWIE